MFLKLFRENPVRVPDPLRPGRTAIVPTLVAAGSGPISDGGSTFEPDADGWIEVPEDVGGRLHRFRFPGGERFCTPHEVNEEVRLGRAAPTSRRKSTSD